MGHFSPFWSKMSHFPGLGPRKNRFLGSLAYGSRFLKSGRFQKPGAVSQWAKNPDFRDFWLDFGFQNRVKNERVEIFGWPGLMNRRPLWAGWWLWPALAAPGSAASLRRCLAPPTGPGARSLRSRSEKRIDSSKALVYPLFVGLVASLRYWEVGI